MRETIVTPEPSEEVTVKPVSLHVSNLVGTTRSIRVEPYATAQSDADRYDRIVVKKRCDYLGIAVVLKQARLLPSVVTAFIADFRDGHRTEFQEMNHALKVITSAAPGDDAVSGGVVVDPWGSHPRDPWLGHWN